MLYAIALVRQSMDQNPVSLPPPEEYSLEETTKEHSFEEAAQPLTEKGRRMRCSKRPVFKRRRRVASLILGLLWGLAVGGLLFLNNTGSTGSELLKQVVPSTIEQKAPETIAEEPVAEEGATE